MITKDKITYFKQIPRNYYQKKCKGKCEGRVYILILELNGLLYKQPSACFTNDFQDNF